MIVDTIATLLLPLSLVVAGFVIGCVLYWRGREPWARRTILASTAALVLLGYGCPTNTVMHWLEHRYPALDPATAQDARWIVVLGAGQRWRPGVPVSSAVEVS